MFPHQFLKAFHVFQPVASFPYSPPRLQLVAKSSVDRGFVSVGCVFGMDSIRDLWGHRCISVHSVRIVVWSASYSGDGFENVQSAPVDKAVMEHTRKAGVVPCQLGWHDIGSFKALKDLKANSDGLALSGNIRLSQSRDCLIETDGPLVAAVGVENLAIIVKDGAVLVLNLDKSQDVKEIVTQLKSEDDTPFL